MFDVAHFLQALFSFLMRPMSLSRHTLALCLGFHLVAARFLHSLPEDTYAFPKYRVSFLNGLPVLKDTAERWLQDGLRGGELEFLDQSWKDALIGNGEAAEVCTFVEYTIITSIDTNYIMYSLIIPIPPMSPWNT